MRHATARFARRLSLLAALAAFPSAHGADDVVAEEQPPVAAPQPQVRILPRIRVQMQQMPAPQAVAEAVEVRREPYLGLVTGPVAEQLRAQLGIPEGIGLAVEAVAKDGPAGRGGVKKFDILRKFDDQLVCTAEQLSALVKAAGKGKEVALTVTRGGKEEVVKVLIDDREVAMGRPAQPAAGVAGRFPQGGLPFDLGGLLGEALPEGLPGIGDEVRVQIQQQVQEALDQAGAGGLGGQAQARVVQIYPGGGSQKVIVHTDQRGTVEIRETDGKRTVTVQDPAGREVHAGPLDTDADRETLPEAFRGMVEEVEGRLGGGAKPAKPAGKPAKPTAEDDEI